MDIDALSAFMEELDRRLQCGLCSAKQRSWVKRYRETVKVHAHADETDIRSKLAAHWRKGKLIFTGDVDASAYDPNAVSPDVLAEEATKVLLPFMELGDPVYNLGNGVGDEESERLAASKVELLKDGKINEECAKDLIAALDKLVAFEASKRATVDQRVVELAGQLSKASAKMAKKQKKNHGEDAALHATQAVALHNIETAKQVTFECLFASNTIIELFPGVAQTRPTSKI